MKPYTIVIFASWIVFSLVWRLAARRAKPSRKSLSWLARMGMRVALVVVVLIVLRGRDFTGVRQMTGPLAFAGCVLCVGGIAFMMWARFSIGTNWGMPMTLRVDHELVTRGPYAYVRHPIYTGMFCTMLGTTLVVPLYGIAAVISAAYFIYSALREERDMLAQFPDQYGAYRRRTKMFFPWLV